MEDAAKPPVVPTEEWSRARAELLVAEKELTRATDAVAARRRRRPTHRMNQDFRFTTTSGPATLLDLFQDRDQLII